MAVELIVPAVGESITEVQIGRWLKAEGEAVAKDEGLAEIETDKVTFELPAPAAGVLGKILVAAGQNALVGAVVGYLDEGAVPAAAPAADDQASPVPTLVASESPVAAEAAAPGVAPRIMPAAAHAMATTGVTVEQVSATGPGGRVLKEDVLRAASAAAAAPAAPTAASVPAGDDEEVVAMSPLRKRVAQRLVQASTEMALLTTFNEVDMSAVMALRRQYQEAFQK